MDDHLALVGACGLYCGACPYAALSESGRADACAGCHGPAADMHPGCAECEIRACAEEKGLLHCGQCAAYPCEKIEAFHADGMPHHAGAAVNIARLNAAGPAAWLEEQAARWTCVCGTSFSWDQGLCYSCGEPVPSDAGS